MTEILGIDPIAPDADTIRAAAGVLVQGGLVAAPSDTVYGLLASAFLVDTLARAFDATDRPFSSPMVVLARDYAEVETLARNIPRGTTSLLTQFWPGPLTVVLLRLPTVSMVVTGGRNTIAVRVPAHSVARSIMEAYGAPIICPPAALFGRRLPLTATDVIEDLDGRIDLILDGGPSPLNEASTVVDLTLSPPTILREGPISTSSIDGAIVGLR